MTKKYNTVYVIDAPCGYGKTQWAIQHMNEYQEDKYIFITPYLDELERIKHDCPDLRFKEPTDSRSTKMTSLKRLLADGRNITSTHSLFASVDDEVLELIEMNDYILILDEVMEVVKQEHITKSDIEMLVRSGILTIDEDGTVRTTEKADNYEGKFSQIVRNAKLGRHLYKNNSLLIWQFPVDVFNAFKKVYNLTYLFDGQIQKGYYDLHKVEIERFSVIKDEESRKYQLIPYDQFDDESFKAFLKENINLYQGVHNKVGDRKTSLSLSWYDRASSELTKTVKKATYNYFNNIIKGQSKDNMWTCFKDHKSKLKGAGYTRGHIAHNARATNKYRHKKNLAYLVNRFPKVMIQDYLRDKGVEIDDKMFALSELIQWVWRSQIRDGKPINLYVPSSRMRSLFVEWMGI